MTSEPNTAADLRLLDIELLQTDAKQALARDRPGTDAIWTALLKPRRTILRNYRAALRAMEEDEPELADQLRAADGRMLVGPLGRLIQADPDVSALLGVGEALVAKALLGDTAATSMLLDRIEGRPGLRNNEVDPDQMTQRSDILDALEATVRKLQERPGDKARDVTPPKANGHDKPVTDVEAEIRDLYPKNGKGSGNGHDK